MWRAVDHASRCLSRRTKDDGTWRVEAKVATSSQGERSREAEGRRVYGVQTVAVVEIGRLQRAGQGYYRAVPQARQMEIGSAGCLRLRRTA